ncbi:MAG: hypothetical protein ABI472_16395 [Ginsengibacter sp.]
MKKNINKADVLATCLQKQEELIESFENRVNESKADTISRNHSASQSEDRTAGKMELLNTYRNELAFAKSEMGFLRSLDATMKHTRVEPGAMVITKQLNFFIGVSSEKIEVNGEEVFGISTNAPIYKMMEGMGKDDKFQFNKIEYIIEAVY